MVDVQPLADSDVEGDETVVLTLLPDAGYTLCVDTQATVEPMGSGLLVQSGPISGVTGIRSGGVWIHRNHMIVPWVHAFLDEVAAPLHARYPLAQVDFDRLV